MWLLAIVLLTAPLSPFAANAQSQPHGATQPDVGQAQQSPAVKPYKAVALTPPVPVTDPSFEAFRKQLADVAKRKDKAALGRMIVAQGFFWEGETGDKTDKAKSPLENLARALSLDDGSSWSTIADHASDPTASEFPERQGVMCSPADPGFNEKELEELATSTQTDVLDWGYPIQDGIEVRSGPQPNAPVIEKLGMHFVHVLTDGEFLPQSGNGAQPLRVATPSGKVGFVSAEAIAPLGGDQLCYIKEGDAWKIVGYVGGEE
jgi:hypothetical protein